MSQAEQPKQSLLEIHKDVGELGKKIAQQRGIVKIHGRNIIPEARLDASAEPEEIIDKIYSVGKKRELLTNRITSNSLPHLENKLAKKKEDENQIIEQARDAYKGIQTLSRLGIYSHREQALLEEGILRLPKEIALQIAPSPLEKRGQEKQKDVTNKSKRGFFARIFKKGGKEKSDELVELEEERIDHTPPPLEEIIDLPEGIPLEEVAPVKGALIENEEPTGSEDLAAPFQEEVATPPAPIETDTENAEEKKTLPDGEFLGNENLITRKIYEALIDLSLHGKLPASKDLENIIFAEEIKTGQLTQKDAHIKIRDGLSLLRRKLQNTGLTLANKGTGRYPFYRIELTGQIPDKRLGLAQNRKKNSLTNQKNKGSKTNDSPSETLFKIEEGKSLPMPEVIGRSGSLRREYYGFLLAKKAEGQATTIKDEADFLYDGDHSKQALNRIYVIRQQINKILKPYGARITTEGRGEKNHKTDLPDDDTKITIPETTQTENPIFSNTPIIEEALTPDDGKNEQGEKPERSTETKKLSLRAGERRTLLMLDGTSSKNSLTSDEIAAKFSPGKKIRREDITTINTFIGGLKTFSLTGSGIEILHPLTQDGNPILNRHYLELPEGKRLEDLVNFEPETTSTRQPVSNGHVERITVPIASVDLQEGTAVEITTSAIPEIQEITLPHFILHESEMEAEFLGKRSRFSFGEQWKIFIRIAQRPNEELTRYELAGLDSQTKDTRALQQAESFFKNLISRFEDDSNQPQIFIITGGNRYPKFTFRATAEFISNPNKSPNENPSQ